MFLAAFVAFKAYTKASENNILHDGFPKNSEQVNVESVDALQAIEPAAGEAETKLPEEEAPAVEEKPAAEEQGDAKEKPLPDYISTERPEETGIGYYCETPNKCKLMVDKLPANERLLLQMSKRRVELEDWKKDLDMRASLIEASSRKLDNKIAQLEELKKSTQALLDEYKGEDDKQIQSMVKIYENMKPKEAAQVFNQLQMPILLEIVQKMNERRVSPILAKMDSKRAKELTEKIIENRGLAKM
jgi:flagellar motility protein MotE (MotC chaperone)